MDLNQEKLELIALVLKTGDADVLAEVRTVFSNAKKKASKKQYPPELMEAIRKGREEIQQGKGLSHAEAEKLYKMGFGK